LFSCLAFSEARTQRPEARPSKSVILATVKATGERFSPELPHIGCHSSEAVSAQRGRRHARMANKAAINNKPGKQPKGRAMLKDILLSIGAKYCHKSAPQKGISA
tara:strand:+ start:664 stop:978 length:315 start_codon:yes stop_codon:yes gene_type:complete